MDDAILQILCRAKHAFICICITLHTKKLQKKQQKPF